MKMSHNETNWESLSQKCLNCIARHLDQYPIAAFGSLAEIEWEKIIQTKYKMTAPKRSRNISFTSATTSSSSSSSSNSSISSTTLSDGRKFPLFIDKIMKEIEEKHTHLSKSKVVDELVWKDNVNFVFPKGGPSRPCLFNEPWDYQVTRCKRIIQDMECYYGQHHHPSSILKQEQHVAKQNKEGGDRMKNIKVEEEGGDVTNDNHDCGYYQHDGNRQPKGIHGSSLSSTSTAKFEQRAMTSKMNIGTIVHELQQITMTVPLLSTSGIGKSLKKFIKTLHRQQSVDTRVTQLEIILNNWKQMASVNGVAMSNTNMSTASTRNHNSQKQQQEQQEQQIAASISGKSRHTSDEQHAQDIIDIQKCHQWRDLFHLLVRRKEDFIKTHGAKMRKIRENIEIGRPKIGKATTKNIARRMVTGSNSGGGIINSSSSSQPMKKLDKLKSQFAQEKAIIRGGKTAKIRHSPGRISSGVKRSFGSSVSAATGVVKKKRSLNEPSTNNIVGVRRGTQRELILNDGKKMKLPKFQSQNQRHFRR